MRALLVVNPKATTTTERTRDLLVRALSTEVDLTVEYTRRRGHGAALARTAAAQGFDVVVTLGGDGTVNEAVNGLMTADDGPAGGRAAERPTLAVVPGGSTNVFARAVGLPRDWAEGTSMIIEGLRERRTRSVSLGKVDDRYFTFCAGFGLDAEIIDRVEQARRRGARSTPMLYLREGLTQYTVGPSRRNPTIVLERAGCELATDLATVVIQNTNPWTYLGDRAITCSPNASFDRGLDLTAIRRLGPATSMMTASRLLTGRPNLTGKQMLQLHDIAHFTLRATAPVALQVDGEYLGTRDKLDFVAVPDALQVVC